MAIALFTGCGREYGDTDEFRVLKQSATPNSKTEVAENHTYDLQNGLLTFANEDGTIIWQSDKYWFVDDFQLADVDRDGNIDCLFSLWKSYSFGREFAADNTDTEAKNHLFLYTIRGGYGKQLWCSSNLPRPIYSFEISGDTLTTIEGDYSDTEKSKKAKLTYTWHDWGFVEQSRSVVKTAKVSLTGDIMLHDNVTRHARTGANSYDFTEMFASIKDFAESRDLFIANLEGPVDAYGENERISEFPRFNFPLEILAAIKNAGINYLITANNHALDQGFAGVKSTRDGLIKAKIDFTGTYENEKQYNEYSIIDVNGIKIGVVAWSALDNGMNGGEWAMRRFNGDTTDDVPQILQDIRQMKKAGAEFVIIALHWGIEYADEPTETQREIARRLTDGGADVIYGSHTHCVQPVETVVTQTGRKALIVYSAGNFFASQEVLDLPKTQRGIVVNFDVQSSEGEAVLSDVWLADTVCEGYETRILE